MVVSGLYICECEGGGGGGGGREIKGRYGAEGLIARTSKTA